MIRQGSRRMLLVVVVALAMLGTMATDAWAAGPTAYVTNYGSDTVTPIDTATNTPGTPIPVGSGPAEVAITPNGQTAYVTNSGDNTVTPIAVATNTPGTPIPVGSGPNEVAITPNGQTAYVANVNDNTVTPIAVATNTSGTPIPVGNGPDGVGITPDGQTAYIANGGGNTVTPIDVATNTPGTPIPVGNSPGELPITPDGRTAYVANGNDNTVTPIDVTTNTPGTPIPVGNSPYGVAITPNGQTAYVTNYGNNTVTPIDVATNTPGSPISVGRPIGVAITPDGQTAYVTNQASATVTPIDVATNTPGTPISVGNTPLGVAITPVAPVDTTAPSISGTAQQGQTLIARHGSWTGNPSGYGYQWQDCDSAGNNCSDISGATGQTYTLTIADAGQTIRVAVSATNAVGTSSPASSPPTNVISAPTTTTPRTTTTTSPPTTTTSPPAAPVTAPSSCLTPAGELSESHLGRVSLGLTRAAARKTVTHFQTLNRFTDNLCLAGGYGTRVGYATRAMTRSTSLATRFKDRIVFATSANPYYSLRGARPGMRFSALPVSLHLQRAMHIGLNTWYVIVGHSTTDVIKARHGVVQEVGILNHQMTTTRAGQIRLLRNF